MTGLQYGKYRFSCQLNADGIMPPYKGSTFRGIFGIALKKVVCALKREECETCLLKKRCVYAIVFETPIALEPPEELRLSVPPHPFHVLARAMLRRISSLFACYAGGEPDLDYKGLLKRAEDIKITDKSLRWHSWERYSNRQKQRVPLGGMMGAVTYEGKLRKYLPLLDFCSKAHIGKNTTFGLGKIRPEILT